MKRRFAPALAIGALALLATVWSGSTPRVLAQAPPTRFFGAAMIDGSPAPVGTEVKAYVNGLECGLALTTVEGRYAVDVQHDATRPGCGADGAEITFALAGYIVDGISTFDTGAFVAFDLNASSANPVAPATENAPQPPIEPPPPVEEVPPVDVAPPPSEETSPPPSDQLPPPAEDAPVE